MFSEEGNACNVFKETSEYKSPKTFYIQETLDPTRPEIEVWFVQTPVIFSCCLVR